MLPQVKPKEVPNFSEIQCLQQTGLKHELQRKGARIVCNKSYSRSQRDSINQNNFFCIR